MVGCLEPREDGPREAQVDPRGVQVSPRQLQDDSRRLRAVPGSSQDVPKDTPEDLRGGKTHGFSFGFPRFLVCEQFLMSMFRNQIKTAPRRPTMAPRRPISAQNGSKIVPRWPQDASRWLQGNSNSPQDGSKTAQDSPRWPHIGRKSAQDGRRTRSDHQGPKPECPGPPSIRQTHFL